MVFSIIRNYRNAGAGVRLELHLADSQRDFDRAVRAVAVHAASGLDIHNLASAAHRDLLRQAMSSEVPRRPTAKFEDYAWMVAAASIQLDEAELMMVGAKNLPRIVPYACFLSEYLSKVFVDEEVRRVCIARDGDVWIESQSGSGLVEKYLGKFKT